MKVVVLQIPFETLKNHRKAADIYAKCYFREPSYEELDYYQAVYSEEVDGNVDILNYLNDLFRRLNEDDRPSALEMHSMSPGDLVILGTDKDIKYTFYCAVCGWRKLNFLNNGDISWTRFNNN